MLLVQQGFAGGIPVFDAVTGGYEPVFRGLDAGFVQGPAGAGEAGDPGGGEGRAGHHGDVAVPEVDEVADGEVAAHFVVAER